MNEMRMFENEEFGAIRTVQVDGEPWFVGNDVARALGYIRTAKAVMDHIENDDTHDVPIQDTIGREQLTRIINESGLYALIMSSKLPSAKKFKKWVTSEVLPAIRKTGSYTAAKVPQTYAEALRAYADEVEEKERLALENQEMKPKSEYCEMVLKSKDVVAIGKIAKDFGMSAQKLNSKLKELGIQYKRDGMWMLYSKYDGKGYTQSKTHPYVHTDGDEGSAMHTYWTQKGRMFIYETMKEEGVLPVVEQDRMLLE